MKSLGADSQSTNYTKVWLVNDLHIVSFVYRHRKYHWPVEGGGLLAPKVQYY